MICEAKDCEHVANAENDIQIMLESDRVMVFLCRNHHHEYLEAYGG